MNLARRCNKYIDETTPWALAKDEANADRLQTVLYNLLECIRMLGIMLSPIMPKCAVSIAEQLNESNNELEFGKVTSYSVGEAKPLFARIDTEKVLAELEEEMKAKQEAAKAENEAAGVAKISQIGIEDFAKVELKTAKIIACEPIKKAYT